MKAQAFSDEQLRRIFAGVDLNSLPETPPNYPPMLSWPPLKNSAGIFKAWEKSAELHKTLQPVVYVHVPFCRTLCRFCGFYKIAPNYKGAVAGYLRALKKEVSLYSGYFRDTDLRFLAVGGGTPTLMSPAELEVFFKTLHGGFRVTAGTKASFEASPASLTLEKLRLIKGAGFDWLAIGAQSLDSALLKKLNRFQTREDVLRSVKLARQAGINQIELDLMAGLPGQSPQSFLDDVRTVAKLDVEKVYLFDYQPRSHTAVAGGLRKGSLDAAELEQVRTLRRQAIDLLLARGYFMHGGHVAVKRSGDAWPYSYDKGEDGEGAYSVLGLGPSAVSYINGRMRYRNVCDEKAYEASLSRGRVPVEVACKLEEKDEMINSLLLDALHRGRVVPGDFSKRFSKSLAAAFPGQLKRLKAARVLVQAGDVLAVTNRARAVYELRKEFYRPEVINLLAAKLGIKKNSPPGAAAAALAPRNAAGAEDAVLENAAPLNVSRRKTYECRLAGLTGLEFYPGAGPLKLAAPGQTARRLMLAAGRGCDEALICAGPEPDAHAVLSAVRAADNLGYKKISVLSPCRRRGLPAPGLMARLGADRLYLICGSNEAENLSAAAKEGLAAGLEICPVLKLDKSNLKKVPAMVKAMGAAGVKKIILFAPRYFPAGSAGPRRNNGLELKYGEIRGLVRAADAMAARSGAEIKFHNVPLCVLYPRWRLAGDYIDGESGIGDGRESDRGGGAFKVTDCNKCRFLLKCAGLFADYVEKFGCGELRIIK